ncbi:YugN family protein [Lentibacillus halophilus]|uniref:YugN family protein n=1 Tax=Lentibacillus halophilus TaxID=295065 RepID=A0ABP3JBQ1_9BACI
MKLENTGIDDAIINVEPLDRLMGRQAFIRGGQWDYERVTYDYKIASKEKNVTYYIRIQGYAVEGDVDQGDALIQLKTPFLGKHYYPHGVEYGEDENFPENLVDRAINLVTKIKEDVDQYKQ